MTEIVFLPGLVSDGFAWQAVAEALPAGTPWQIADLSGPASIEAMAAHALTMTAGAVILAGHSMGGRVAMEAARQAPDRVSGLVLANTGHAPLAPGEADRREASIALGHRSMAALAGEWLPPMVAPERHADTALMNALTDMVLRAGPDVHERQIRALMARPDAARHLPAIACPILVLAAMHDLWSPVAQHKEIVELAPDAELEVIGGAGHVAPVEAPGQVARAIRNWLIRRALV